MQSFTAVTILYNPNSTGASKTLATDFAKKFKGTNLEKVVAIKPTKHAGHGLELAYQLAKASARPLIISSSGDGGYHEVVNGIMKASLEGAQAVAGLLPAGNANDHYNNIHEDGVEQRILHGACSYIDLLEVRIGSAKSMERYYAHSYAGIGLTPKVGTQLNKTTLNRWNEVIIVIRTLLSLRAVKIRIDDTIRAYNSLICSNVPKMSKVLHLSKQAQVDDGKFEVTTLRRGSQFHLFHALLKAVTGNPEPTQQQAQLTLTTIAPLAMQLDGEIIQVGAKTNVSIDIAPQALACII